MTRILEALADAELRLRDAASKKILLEVTLLRAIEARNALPIDAVLKQLNQLRSSAPQSSASVSPTRQEAAPVHQRAEPILVVPTAPVALRETPFAASAAPVAAGNLPQLWSQLVEAVGRASTFTRSYLLNAHPVSFEKNIFIIGFDPEFEDYLGLVDNSRNHTLLATKLAELGHHNAMIKFVKAAAPAGWNRAVATAPTPTPAPAPAAKPAAAPVTLVSAPAVAEKKTAPVSFNKEEFKNDPLIQKALEIFKGTIVEVRA